MDDATKKIRIALNEMGNHVHGNDEASSMDLVNIV